MTCAIHRAPRYLCSTSWFPAPARGRRKTEQRAIIRKLASDGVDDFYRALAHAMHQTRNAERRIFAEDERIKPRMRHAVVDHLDVFEAMNRLEINAVVEDEQVSALD